MRPSGFEIPGGDSLTAAVSKAIAECRQAQFFADPPITQLTWSPPKRTKKADAAENDDGTQEDSEDGDDDGDAPGGDLSAQHRNQVHRRTIPRY